MTAFYMVNQCVNPKPVHSAGAIPVGWADLEGNTNAYNDGIWNYSDGGLYHGRTTLHVNHDGWSGSPYISFKPTSVTGEVAAGDYVYMQFTLGEYQEMSPYNISGLCPRLCWYDAGGTLLSDESAFRIPVNVGDYPDYTITLGDNLFTTGWVTFSQLYGPAPAGASKYNIAIYIEWPGMGIIPPYNVTIDCSFAEVLCAWYPTSLASKFHGYYRWFDGDEESCEWASAPDRSTSTTPWFPPPVLPPPTPSFRPHLLNVGVGPLSGSTPAVPNPTLDITNLAEGLQWDGTTRGGLGGASFSMRQPSAGRSTHISTNLCPYPLADPDLTWWAP